MNSVQSTSLGFNKDLMRLDIIPKNLAQVINSTMNFGKGGVIPIMIFDTIVFIIAFFIAFCCIHRFDIFSKKLLWKKNKKKNKFKNKENDENDNNNQEDDEDDDEVQKIPISERERDIFQVIFKKIINFFKNCYYWIFTSKLEEKFLKNSLNFHSAFYLWFSKQFILIFTIFLITSIPILIPIHVFLGTPPKIVYRHLKNFHLVSDDYFLIRTTPLMVSSDPYKLIPHVLFCFFFTIVMIIFLNRFYSAKFLKKFIKKHQTKKSSLISKYTVVVNHLPKKLYSSKKIKKNI